MENSQETINPRNVENDHVQLDHLKHDHVTKVSSHKLHEDRLSEQEILVLPGTTERYPSGWRLYIIIVALLLGTLLVAIDNTIIGVVIPRITTIFNDLEDVGWYGSAYLLTVTALQPIFGNLFKFFRVKIVYLVSVAIFEGNPTTHI